MSIKQGILKVVYGFQSHNIINLGDIHLGDTQSTLALAFQLFDQEFPNNNDFTDLISSLNTLYGYQIQFSYHRFIGQDNADVNCLVLTMNDQCNPAELKQYLVRNYFSLFVEQIQ